MAVAVEEPIRAELPRGYAGEDAVGGGGPVEL